MDGNGAQLAVRHIQSLAGTHVAGRQLWGTGSLVGAAWLATPARLSSTSGHQDDNDALGVRWYYRSPLFQPSLDAEGAGLFDGQQQLLVEHVEGRVRRKVQTVEAGVSSAWTGLKEERSWIHSGSHHLKGQRNSFCTFSKYRLELFLHIRYRVFR